MILPRRILALTLLVAFTTSGSGLPMCLESLAQLAAPCEMHADGRGRTGTDRDGQGHTHPIRLRPSLSVSVTPVQTHSCHSDADVDAGCLATGACPTAGTPAPGALGLEAGSLAPTHASFRCPVARFPSFLAPPLAPPPQA